MIYSYSRVSTTEQAADDRSSIDDQQRRIAGVAMMRGEQIAAAFVDAGISGSIPLAERPDGKRLMAALKPGDIIIAAKLDRLFRSASDALATVEALARRKIDIIFADMGPDPVTANGVSKLFFSMLAAFAEFERTRIAERVADGRKAKALRHGHIGGDAPYGYRVVGSGRQAMLEEVPEERSAVNRMRELLALGLSYRDIAVAIANDGIVNRNGTSFTYQAIHRILSRSTLTNDRNSA